METDGDFHDQVANATSVEADAVLDHPTALHTTNRVFDPNPPASKGLVCRFLLDGQFTAARLLEGLKHLDPVEREGQKAKILEQLAPFRQLIIGKVSDVLVGFTALLGAAQIQNHQRSIYEQEVFDRVEAFLAAAVQVSRIAV